MRERARREAGPQIPDLNAALGKLLESPEGREALARLLAEVMAVPGRPDGTAVGDAAAGAGPVPADLPGGQRQRQRARRAL
jgi:hypothetical protein